jgi:hypothetical protein
MASSISWIICAIFSAESAVRGLRRLNGVDSAGMAEFGVTLCVVFRSHPVAALL